MQRVAVGEHVALGERPGAVVFDVLELGDAMVEQPPARDEQVVELARIDVDLVVADVLDHPDRADRVELLALQLAIVGDADLDAVGQAGVGDAPAGQLGLLDGERDSDERSRRDGARRGSPCCPSRSRRRAAGRPRSARAWSRSARAWSAEPPRASSRPGSTPRSCRSSTRRGTARRRRCPRCSGRRPPSGRGRGCAAGPSGASRSSAPAAARRAHTHARAPVRGGRGRRARSAAAPSR